MTSKERVLTALNHEEPDKVPLDIPFTPEAAEKLIAYLKDEKQITAESSDLAVVMNHDILAASHGIGASYYAQDLPEYTCEWGITWRWVTLPGGGRYTEMVSHQLDDESARARLHRRGRQRGDVRAPADQDAAREDRALGLCVAGRASASTRAPAARRRALRCLLDRASTGWILTPVKRLVALPA